MRVDMKFDGLSSVMTMNDIITNKEICKLYFSTVVEEFIYKTASLFISRILKLQCF